MTFANAGHNFPLYCTEGKRYIKIENTPDLPLAVMEEAEYENHYMDLREGDRLFLYTDGVTEAMDENGELYGEERLCRVLDVRGEMEEKKMNVGNGVTDHAEINNVNIKETDILHNVREDLMSFSGEAVQADDITMMSFLYINKKSDVLDCGSGDNIMNWVDKKDIQDTQNFEGNQNSIKVRADLCELSRVIEFVDGQLKQGGFSMEFVTTIKFISDELFSNIAMYAYDGVTDGSAAYNCMGINKMRREKGKFAVITVNALEKNAAELVFEDWGKPYNPLEQQEPDVSLSGEERMEGGLGIYLVKSMADKMEYKCENGKNVVLVRKSVKEGD